MSLEGVTWLGPAVDDTTLLDELPVDLADLLRRANGFVLRDGALHVRGACCEPAWHSLRAAWRGEAAFHRLYPEVRIDDVPFAQDCLGDQFLLRSGTVVRLAAEIGDVTPTGLDLAAFLDRASRDGEAYLPRPREPRLRPGELVLAYPPFVTIESSRGVSLKAITALDVIAFHADLARQLRGVPDGAKIRLVMGDDGHDRTT
jgi:hypothetical protein